MDTLACAGDVLPKLYCRPTVARWWLSVLQISTRLSVSSVEHCGLSQLWCPVWLVGVLTVRVVQVTLAFRQSNSICRIATVQLIENSQKRFVLQPVRHHVFCLTIKRSATWLIDRCLADCCKKHVCLSKPKRAQLVGPYVPKSGNKAASSHVGLSPGVSYILWGPATLRACVCFPGLASRVSARRRTVDGAESWVSSTCT